MQVLLWLLITVGHIGFWCAVFNRTHATAWPRTWRKLIEWGAILVTGGPLVAVPVWLAVRGWQPAGTLADHSVWMLGYMALCVAVASLFSAIWLFRNLTFLQPQRIERTGVERLQPERDAGLRMTAGWIAGLLRLVPGNQIVELAVERYRIRIGTPFDPAAPLRIAQLSDLHFTGFVRREYFQRVVDCSNAFAPDLVLVTGDIVDEEHCLDWIVPVLGRLRAPLGVWYVLGNHDRRIRDEATLRRLLAEAGLHRAAGAWHDLRWQNRLVRLTGNELPWYAGADGLATEPEGERPALRLLLSHSPDQFGWARKRNFDLVFAGHTHGGQICLPVIGPIIAPSRHGVRYASGDFEEGGVLMHVSRGLSGDDPIRWNCPPELGLFEVLLPAADAGIAGKFTGDRENGLRFAGGWSDQH